MSEASNIAAEIQGKIPSLMRGTLRFWGVWFGKAYDNVHTVVRCHSDGDILHIEFDQREVLKVWEPSRLVASSTEFKIKTAARVRWEWFYYGRPQIPENRYFEDFEIGRDGESNVDWFVPNLKCDFRQAAVEVL